MSTENPDLNKIYNAKIIVIGVGGGGCNTIQYMIDSGLKNVEFIAVNTDANSLQRSTSPLKVQIGVKLTNGLGAGCDPNKGRKAAEESTEDLKQLLTDADMVFITAGMGGGTGTGAAPIIAQVARDVGALTVAVVTKPFSFEGKRHSVNAESGITELSKFVDSLIVIDNNKLLHNLGANVAIVKAFEACNDVLLHAVQGITDAITIPSYINLDFADVVTIMRGRGHSVICNGFGKGPTFVEDAVDKAINSPLMDRIDIRSATGIMAYIKANPNFPISQLDTVSNSIQSYAEEEADCKFGLYFDENLAEDEVSVTMLITGISTTDPRKADTAFNHQFASYSQAAPKPNPDIFAQAQNSAPAQAVQSSQSTIVSQDNPATRKSDGWILPEILNSK